MKYRIFRKHISGEKYNYYIEIEVENVWHELQAVNILVDKKRFFMYILDNEYLTYPHLPVIFTDLEEARDIANAITLTMIETKNSTWLLYEEEKDPKFFIWKDIDEDS